MKQILPIMLATLALLSCMLVPAAAETDNTPHSYQSTSVRRSDDLITDNGDSTRTISRVLQREFTSQDGYTIRCSIPVTVISCRYGSTWAACDQTGSIVCIGDGDSAFIGACSAVIVSPTQLRIAVDGYFKIPLTYGRLGQPLTFDVEPIEYTLIETAPVKRS